MMEDVTAVELNRTGLVNMIDSNEHSKHSMVTSELCMQPRRWTQHWRTLMATVIAALGACGLGTVISYPAVAVPDMISRQNRLILNDLEVALVVSLSSVGGLAGAIMGGIFLDRYGRKSTLIFTTAPFVFGWLMIVASPNVYCLCAGRLLTGWCAGVMDVGVPVYLSEIPAASVRGFMGSFHDLFTNIGILYTFAFSNFLSWKSLAEVCLFLPVLMAVGMLIVPESPRWLFKVGRREECEYNLRWLRGHDDIVNQEISEMTETARGTQKPVVSWAEFLKPDVYRPLFIVIGLLLLEQMTALGIFQYTVRILEAGKSTWSPDGATAVMGALGVLSNLLSAFIVDRLGRRKVLLTSAAVVTLSLAGLATSFTVIELNLSYNIRLYSVAVFMCIIIFNTALSFGFGPIPFYLANELLPIRVRGVAGGLAIASMWVFTFISGMAFPYAVNAMGYYGVFWMTTGFALVSTVFAFILIPETKGLSLEQIEKNNSMAN